MITELALTGDFKINNYEFPRRRFLRFKRRNNRLAYKADFNFEIRSSKTFMISLRFTVSFLKSILML